MTRVSTAGPPLGPAAGVGPPSGVALAERSWRGARAICTPPAVPRVMHVHDVPPHLVLVIIEGRDLEAAGEQARHHRVNTWSSRMRSPMTIAWSPTCLNAAYEPSAKPGFTGTPLTVT